MENNHLNLAIIGRYHITLAGGPSLSSSPFPSIFFLNRDKPHVEYTFSEANSSLYKHNHWGIHVSFDIPNSLDIKFSLPRNYK